MALTEVVRQNNKLFIDLLNKVLVGNNDDDVEHLLKARFIHESNENYPNDVLHMHAENELAMKRNKAVLNDLPCQLYTTEVMTKFQIIVNTHWHYFSLLRIKSKQTQAVLQSCLS